MTAGGLGDRAQELTHLAVQLAIQARENVPTHPVWIAGSIAPVEDCYRPDLVPADDALRAEHQWLATELLRAEVDLVLIETMNTEREARIALEQVLAAGGRAWVSFVCQEDARLLSGEPLAAAARAVEADGADAVLVNCTALEPTEACLRALRDACDGPIGAYPNLEPRRGGAISPDHFAATLGGWHDELGATLLGGCCGTTPAHIAALRARLA
jgi:S-methylmethionine-dependent homocysteine/selenocysteine methylase